MSRRKYPVEEKNKQNHKIHIAVENFGPIEKAEIDLRPLTIFVGESNTGKTYLAALIYAIQRAFDGIPRLPWAYYNTSHFDPIYHSGPADLSSEKANRETRDFQKKLTLDNNPLKFSDLPMWVRERLLSGNAHTENLCNELKRCFDIGSVSKLRRDSSIQNQDMKVSFKVNEENLTIWSYDFYNSQTEDKTEKYINENIILNAQDRELFSKALNVKDQQIPLRFLTPASSYYYLPAARSGIMETYGLIAISLVDRATRVAIENSENDSMLTAMTADFLKHLYSYKKKDISDKYTNEIADRLEEKILHGKIELYHAVEGGFPQFLYRPKNTEKSLRMSQASAMVSELAPLVLILKGIVKPEDTLFIEEPEAHLHPRAQTKIAITLARLVRAGVRVIITTHSNWLLQQIGNLIREGELNRKHKDEIGLPHWLSKDEVGVWWFHADKPVEEIPFDRIEGIEPSDYEDVTDYLYNTFVEFERQFLNEKADSEYE